MQESDGTTAGGTYWRRIGPAGAIPVVLIHGLGLTHATWDALVPELAESHDVIQYDLIGHGRSGPPPEGLSLRDFGAQVIELLDGLAVERAHLVGFSLGGMINRRVAIDHPERVASLAILNSPHARGVEAQRLVEQRALDSAAGGPSATIDATLQRWFTPNHLEDHPDQVAAVRALVLANDLQHYAAARWVLANGVTELIEPEPPIRIPTLVMTCRHDTGSTPEMAEKIAAEIAGARLDIVEGRQHLGLLEDPQRFTAPILSFLAEA